MARGWAWGLCSLVSLEAAFLGPRDPRSSARPRPHVSLTRRIRWVLSDVGRGAPSVERGSLNPSPGICELYGLRQAP